MSDIHIYIERERERERERRRDKEMDPISQEQGIRTFFRTRGSDGHAGSPVMASEAI